MKLYDTAQRGYVKFTPRRRVDMYICGITPYDSAHLGHIFTFLTYDLLQRRLEDMGHEVRLVRNITDVDEPIYARAKELGVRYTELAKREIDTFRKTMRILNFKEPYAEPLASEYIGPMAQAVKQLLDHNYAYYVDGDLYFDTAKSQDFASFSGFSESLRAGLFALRGGDPDRPGKRNPFDFLLWKSVEDSRDPAQWPSPLGAGRPGWHIECSIMSEKLLGAPFDIHGGGSDLIFPHHSAEFAQSVGLGQSQLAKHWVHVYPLFSDGEKMSKSLGNLVFAKNLLNSHEPAVIRLALMHYHHRIGGEWQPELLHSAISIWSRLQKAIRNADKQASDVLLKRIRDALDDDINTLEIIDALHSFITKTYKPSKSNSQPVLQQSLRLIGLLEKE